MNKVFFIFLFIFLAVPCTLPAQQVAERDYIEWLRARIQADKVVAISQAMQLTNEGAAVFWPLYNAYEKEVATLGEKRISLLESYAKVFDTMDESIARELLKQSLAWRKEREQTLERFVFTLEEAMSPIVAARFYQVERYLTLLLDLKVANQIPLIQKGSDSFNIIQEKP